MLRHIQRQGLDGNRGRLHDDDVRVRFFDNNHVNALIVRHRGLFRRHDNDRFRRLAFIRAFGERAGGIVRGADRSGFEGDVICIQQGVECYRAGHLPPHVGFELTHSLAGSFTDYSVDRPRLITQIGQHILQFANILAGHIWIVPGTGWLGYCAIVIG